MQAWMTCWQRWGVALSGFARGGMLPGWGLAIGMAAGAAFGMAAQPQSWFAYLYNHTTSELLRIGHDGSIQGVPLGLPPDTYIAPDPASFTQDGTRMAMCAVRYGEPVEGEPPPSTAQLTIRDLAAQSEIVTRDLGIALGCQAFFRSDDAFLAVGLVRAFPGESAAELGVHAWEIQILDPVTGAMIASLTPDNQASAAIALPGTGTFLPRIRRFEGQQLWFNVLPYATEVPSSTDAYRWQIDQALLTPEPNWRSFALDWLLATGELAWLALDETRPVGTPGGPVPVANVVELISEATPEARTVLHSPDWLLIDVHFIEDGRRLAIQQVAAFDSEQQTLTSPTRWLALDRLGQTSELLVSTEYTQLLAAPGGYLLLEALPGPNQSYSVRLEYGSGEARTLLWAQNEPSQASYSLVYVTPASAAPDLSAFPPVD